MYSANGEDEILIRYGIDVRHVVDIGAGDGQNESHTRVFIEQYGATAVMVEPDPYAFGKLFDYYSSFGERVTCANMAIVPEASSLMVCTMHVFRDHRLTTLRPDYPARWSVQSCGSIMVVPGDAEHVCVVNRDMGTRTPNLIHVNARGFSHHVAYEIPRAWMRNKALRGIIVNRDWERDAHGRWHPSSTDRLRAQLQEFGFREYHVTNENTIYVRDK